MRDPKEETPAASTGSSDTQRRTVDVQNILGPSREAILVHAGENYLLRITANGKLILTK